jgi:uncharacterized protein YdeI (YjbR/CyaY-like superfamily)
LADAEIKIFSPANLADWRAWLAQNHATESAVWLVFYSKSSGKKAITWSESVDVALCFGWIDSKKVKIDSETSHQFFSRRKPKSTWSKINKLKVQQLIENGLMEPAGHACIKIAKANGSWTIFDEAEALIVPADLQKEFEANADVKDYYLALSKTGKKGILHKLALAKLPETRLKRISEVIAAAKQKAKPKT